MSGNDLTILGVSTFVRGDVFSDDILVVEGGVEGNIVGNRVIVKARGWLHGNLKCRSLSIEPGGVVDGAVTVTTAESLKGNPDMDNAGVLPAAQAEKALPPSGEGMSTTETD